MISSNFLVLFLLATFASIILADPVPVRWCVTSADEKQKCNKFILTLNRTELGVNITVGCVEGTDALDCIKKIEKGEADLVTLDGGLVLIAGKDHNLVPVVAEDYGGDYGTSYYAVAVVRKNNTGFDINSLKGKKSCHTGAGKNAGWNVPVGFLLSTKKMPLDPSCCPYKSTASFFEKSCVPGADKYPDKLCALCNNGKGAPCSSTGPFSGYAGAFMCMAKGYGDVAFIKHTTVSEMVTADPAAYGNVSSYEYLCPDGGRKDIGQHKTCTLGVTPSHAVMTKKGSSNLANYKSILLVMSAKYGINQTDSAQFQLFNSTKYGGKDLMFKDSTVKLIDVGEKNSYEKWLGKQYMDDLMALNKKCDSKPDPKDAAGATASLAILVFVSAILALLGF